MSGSEALRNDSYHSIKHLGPKQDAVLFIIEISEPVSDRQIAQSLGWPINRVIPRRSELVEFGLVIKAGESFDPITNRIVSQWRTQT